MEGISGRDSEVEGIQRKDSWMIFLGRWDPGRDLETEGICGRDSQMTFLGGRNLWKGFRGGRDS